MRRQILMGLLADFISGGGGGGEKGCDREQIPRKDFHTRPTLGLVSPGLSVLFVLIFFQLELLQLSYRSRT